MKSEFGRLNQLIGALLGTKTAENLGSSIARARAAGDPYDPACLERLQLLFGELRGRALPRAARRLRGARPRREQGFLRGVLLEHHRRHHLRDRRSRRDRVRQENPTERPKDADDILGTYRIVSDLSEMRKTPKTFAELHRLLLSRHATLLEWRPEAAPGKFKEMPNRAGETVFVRPELVNGTLKKGIELHADLPKGLARAIFILFLAADVHPFVDGNGRIARIMMNAELASEGLSTSSSRTCIATTTSGRSGP